MTTTDPTKPHICTADGGPACPGHTPPPLPPEPDPGPYLIGEFFALRRDGTTTAERWLSISIAEGGHRWSSWEDLAREAGCPDVPIRRLVPAPEPVTLPWHLSSINGWGSGGVRLAADNPAAPVGYSIEDQVRFMSIAEARAMAAALLSAADVAERAAAVATGRPPRASAGASLVSGEYDEAAAHHDALLRQVEQARAENARLRTELAEAREQRDHAQRWNDEARRAWAVDSAELAVVRGELAAARQETARVRSQLAEAREALVRAETERDEARADLAWLRRQVLAVAEDLERYASDLRWESLERKLAWTLRQIVAGERPETAPESPQTGEQAQVRGESHTEPAGTVDDALHRIALHRIADHLGIPPPWISPAETAWRVIAEIDRLRTERDRLRRRLGDVLDLEELPEDHTIVAAVRRLRAALGTTPDTGSTT